VKTQKAYLNQYYEMSLKLSLYGENADTRNATDKQLAKLEDLKQKAIQQSGLTEAEMAFICIRRLASEKT